MCQSPPVRTAGAVLATHRRRRNTHPPPSNVSGDLSRRPWGVCPKDTLGPTEGAVVPHAPLWWTTLLVWGTSLCLQRLSVCARCHCAVSWKNSAIKMLLGMKRKIFGRVHYQVTFGGQVHSRCSCRCCNHTAENALGIRIFFLKFVDLDREEEMLVLYTVTSPFCISTL